MRRFSTPLWFLVSATIFSLAVQADEPTIDELLALAPRIDASDSEVRTAEISVCVKADVKNKHVHLRFRALYRAPDQYALFVSDRRDGVPLIYATQGQALIYDPFRPMVIHIKDGNPKVSIEWGHKLEFGLGVTAAEPSLKLDVRALAILPRHESLVDAWEGGYRAAFNNIRGSSVVAIVDPSKPHPYRKLMLFVDGDESDPNFSIERMAVNEEISDEDFRFPKIESIRAKIAVEELCKDEPLLAKLCGTAHLMRACYVRIGAGNPEFRESFDEVIDWDAVAENDRKFALALSEALAQSADTDAAVDD